MKEFAKQNTIRDNQDDAFFGWLLDAGIEPSDFFQWREKHFRKRVRRIKDYSLKKEQVVTETLTEIFNLPEFKVMSDLELIPEILGYMGHEAPKIDGVAIEFRNPKRKSRKEVDYDDNPTRIHYVGCGACTCDCKELKNKRFKAVPRT